MKLADFFAHAPAYLFSEQPTRAFERALGRSESGTANLGFYPVLVRRNIGKILREVYAGLCAYIEREHDELFRELVEAYWRAHPPSGWDPNHHAAAKFPSFLSSYRAREPRLTDIHEELADFHWSEFLVWAALDTWPDDKGVDGVDHRLFVRQYSRRIPDFARGLIKDASTPLPAPEPTPTLIYRDPKTLRVAVLYPSVTALVVLSGRQKRLPLASLAGSIPGLTVAMLESVERDLLERGIALGAPAGSAA